MKKIIMISILATATYAGSCSSSISKVYSLLELKQNTMSRLSSVSFGYSAIDNAMFSAKINCRTITEKERVENLEKSVRAMKSYSD